MLDTCKPEEYCVAVKVKKDTVGSCKCGANMARASAHQQLRYELTDYMPTLRRGKAELFHNYTSISEGLFVA